MQDRDKVQDCKDRSGLHFVKFDLVTGGQKIKIAIVGELCWFNSSYFFAFITFGDLFYLFQDDKVSSKQAPGHEQDILAGTISL